MKYIVVSQFGYPMKIFSDKIKAEEFVKRCSLWKIEEQNG